MKKKAIQISCLIYIFFVLALIWEAFATPAVHSIEIISKQIFSTPRKVFNLTVESNSNYHVSPKAILVHNTKKLTVLEEVKILNSPLGATGLPKTKTVTKVVNLEGKINLVELVKKTGKNRGWLDHYIKSGQIPHEVVEREVFSTYNHEFTIKKEVWFDLDAVNAWLKKIGEGGTGG